MDFLQVVFARRSIRRYTQQDVSPEDLRQLIEFARVAPSGSNSQKLRFTVIRTPELAEKIFALTGWAGHVKPRRTPVWGKDAPRSFIALTVKKALSSPTVQADAGAAVENIMLGAAALGLGSCWIGSFDKERTHELLELDPETEVLYLVALGYPAEEPVWEDAADPQNIKYYLDEKDQLHVPKLTVEELTEWK